VPNETLARRYATAVFSLAQDAGTVAGVKTDLHTAHTALAADPAVQRFFRSPVVDRKAKAELLGRAFATLDPIALHTVLLLVRKRREAIFGEMVAQYDILEQRSRAASPLRVESARELSAAELDALVAKLGRLYQTTFDVTQTVDPALIGGVRITLGDKRIDGSVAGRLDDIARMLSTN
jgi:F-type H+-transporting ATPase subunit delta